MHFDASSCIILHRVEERITACVGRPSYPIYPLFVLISAYYQYSGVIINTCGWIENVGYELIVHAANAMKVDVILVIGNERLFQELKADAKLDNTAVAKLGKSEGVVTRDQSKRAEARSKAIKHYFYGHKLDLYPHTMVLPFAVAHIYSDSVLSQLPSSLLPANFMAPGSSASDGTNPHALGFLNPVQPSADLLHSILAVSFAKSEEALLESPVAGYVYVIEVDMQNKKLTILSPTRGHLPSTFLISGSLKWYDK